jgi:hypothetical protein
LYEGFYSRRRFFYLPVLFSSKSKLHDGDRPMMITEIICGAISLPAFGVMAAVLSKTRMSENGANVRGASPEAAVPTLDTDVEKLRGLHHVTLVTADLEGNSIDQLLPGSYGFTCAPTQASPVYQTRISHSFEVHKLPDGNVHIVGFVTEDQAVQLYSGQAILDLNLYPEPWELSYRCVSLSRSRITGSKGPSRSNGNALTIDLSAEVRGK